MAVVRESVVSEGCKSGSSTLAGMGEDVSEEGESILRSSQSSCARQRRSQLSFIPGWLCCEKGGHIVLVQPGSCIYSPIRSSEESC